MTLSELKFSDPKDFSSINDYDSLNLSENDELRKTKKISVISNLIPISFNENIQNVIMYKITFSSKLCGNIKTFQNKIIENATENFEKIFKLYFVYDQILFAIGSNLKKVYEIESFLEEESYSILLNSISSLNFEGVIENPELLNNTHLLFLNQLFSHLLAKDNKNIQRFRKENKIHIIKSYFNDLILTKNGLYAPLSNSSIFISNETILEKLLKMKNSEKNFPSSNEKLEKYIKEHKTVIFNINHMQIFKIKEIYFDRTPNNTCISIKKGNINQTLTLVDYYQYFYKVDIKNKNQPLILGELKKNNNVNYLNENICYLIPEFLNEVIENESIKKNEESFDIKFDESIIKEAEKWGLSFGEKIILDSKLIQKPKLEFIKKEASISIEDSLLNIDKLKNANIIYIYEKNDHKNYKKLIYLIFKQRISDNNIEKILTNSKGYSITNSLDEITKSLKIIKKSLDKNSLNIVLIFLSENTKQFFNDIKTFFLKNKIMFQYIPINAYKKNNDSLKIIFNNILQLITTKKYTNNYYIDFYRNNLFPLKSFNLIITLKSKENKNKQLKYTITSNTSKNFDKVLMESLICENCFHEKEKILQQLIKTSIYELKEICKESQLPETIIIFRKKDDKKEFNYDEETKIILNYLNSLKNTYGNYMKYNPKLTYIIYGINYEIKILEIQKNKGEINFNEPRTGLCIDKKIKRKEKEFYLEVKNKNKNEFQHYEIFYQDTESFLELNVIEILSYYLSFYPLYFK